MKLKILLLIVALAATAFAIRHATDIRNSGEQVTNEAQNDIWEKARLAMDDGYQTVTLYGCYVQNGEYHATVVSARTRPTNETP